MIQRSPAHTPNGYLAPIVTRTKRRPPDIMERLLAFILGGAMVVSILLVLALGIGLVWLIVVVVQDLGRRLS